MAPEATKQCELDTLKSGETWRLVKNVVIISLAFMVHFTAYNGTANLQSSINAEAGLGTASLAAVFASLIFSNVFLPVVTIRWLGTKWAMSLAFITYVPYIAAQFYPTFYTMIPAALIVGLGAAPLWCAMSTYLSLVSEAYSKISKISAEVLLSRFLGLFFMIYQLNQVWGNLISSLVLSSSDNAAAVVSLNASLIPKLCGANFLPSADAGAALPPQPQEKIQMIAGIYLACVAAAALIVAVGVDSMKRYEVARKSDDSPSGLALLVITLSLMLEPNQLLMVIIDICAGYQQAFFSADFTAAFVSCVIGTGSVGFVMMTYGVTNAIGAVVTGYLAKVTGRLPLVCAAAVLQTALLVTMLAWRPQSSLSYPLYLIAGLWGLCDSIWLVQLKAFTAILFPGREEAAYSSIHLCESIGFIIAYVISPYLRISSKIYLILAMVVTGVAGYCVAEVRHRRSREILESTHELPAVQFSSKGYDNVVFEKDR